MSHKYIISTRLTRHLHLVEIHAIIQAHFIQRGSMYDDYDLEYMFEGDYDLDADTYHNHHLDDNGMNDDAPDDDYARDTQDYESLAYQHYA